MINTPIYRVKENFFPSIGFAKRGGFSKEPGEINNRWVGAILGSLGRNRLDNRLQSHQWPRNPGRKSGLRTRGEIQADATRGPEGIAINPSNVNIWSSPQAGQSSSSSSISVSLGPDTQRKPTAGCLSEGSKELRNLHLEWIR